jgi:hypothetical protein
MQLTVVCERRTVGFLGLIAMCIDVAGKEALPLSSSFRSPFSLGRSADSQISQLHPKQGTGCTPMQVSPCILSRHAILTMTSPLQKLGPPFQASSLCKSCVVVGRPARGQLHVMIRSGQQKFEDTNMAGCIRKNTGGCLGPEYFSSLRHCHQFSSFEMRTFFRRTRDVRVSRKINSCKGLKGCQARGRGGFPRYYHSGIS